MSVADADMTVDGVARQPFGAPLRSANWRACELVDSDNARAAKETGGGDEYWQDPRARQVCMDDVGA
jgi:hypothetical protein